MTSPWKKAARDFWQERTRTFLVMFAIALGISAFTAVLSTYAILTRELNAGYLATNPASATLRLNAVDDALLTAVLADPRIAEAEARRSLAGKIKTGPAEWKTLILFVVKDYGNIHVSRLNPENGAWPPAVGEILIERDAFQVAKVRIGDRVAVKTINGTEQSLLVSGGVHDVGQAQARMENVVYGYITLDTLRQLGEQPFLDQLKIVVAKDKLNEQHIRSVANDLQRLAEARGYVVTRAEVPVPGKHPHASIMGLLLLSMSSFGIFVLLLSGVLVINLLTAVMASQVRQIGMMRALGGTRFQIAGIYFNQALILGVAAVLIATPVGTLGGRVLCRYMAVFLNFDITSFLVPLWVYALVMAIGLAAPLLSAAYPIAKGLGMSVQAALADFGISPASFGDNTFDRALAAFPGIKVALRYAFRNGFRRRSRLALTVLTLAIGGLFFMSALNVRASMINTLDRMFAARKYDLQVGLGSMYPMEKVDRAVHKTPGIVRVEGWLVAEGSIPLSADALRTASMATHASSRSSSTPEAAMAMHGSVSASGHGGGVIGSRVSIIALPAGTDLIQPNMIEGRNLQPGDMDTVLVNQTVAATYPQVKVGSTVTVQMGAGPVTWKVVGITREPFSPAIAYVPIAFFERNGHAGLTNSLRLVLQSPSAATISRVKADLDRNLSTEGIRALNGISKADSRFGFDQHMVMIYVFLVIMSCIVAVVGGLGLTTTMSLNVLERRREMGVLRAIGASPRAVWMIVIAEGAFVAVLSWLAAALAAWPLSKAIGNLLVRLMFQSELDFTFEGRGLAVWLLVCVSLGLLASFLPAWHACQQPVRESIANE
jgi:putative ABC transport system permease protein